MKKLLQYSFLLLISTSCTPEDEFDHTPNIRLSDTYNNLFTRYGDGWTGGDGTISLKLSNGKVLWFFGDTFLDTVYSDRSRPNNSGLIKNSLVVQDGNELQTYYSRTFPPTAYAKPENPDQWYWPLGAIEQENVIEIAYQKLEQIESNTIFNFISKGTDIIQIDKEDFSILNQTKEIDHDKLAFGATILKTEDFIFIYGVETAHPTKHMHLARVPIGSLFQEWEYLNGVTWSTDLNQSKRLFEGVSDQYSVFVSADKFYLLTQEINLSNRILLYEANDPKGPWENERIIYHTPDLGKDIWSYNAMAHPWISEENELLISYNVNSFNFNDIFINADFYRPYFIVLEDFPN